MNLEIRNMMTRRPVAGETEEDRQLFRDLVAEDAKEKLSEHEKEWLRSPEILLRWRGVILNLLDDVEEQINAHKALHGRARDELQDWRRHATHFRDRLTVRLQECEELIEAQKPEVQSEAARLKLFLRHLLALLRGSGEAEWQECRDRVAREIEEALRR